MPKITSIQSKLPMSPRHFRLLHYFNNPALHTPQPSLPLLSAHNGVQTQKTLKGKENKCLTDLHSQNNRIHSNLARSQSRRRRHFITVCSCLHCCVSIFFRRLVDVIVWAKLHHCVLCVFLLTTALKQQGSEID